MLQDDQEAERVPSQDSRPAGTVASAIGARAIAPAAGRARRRSSRTRAPPTAPGTTPARPATTPRRMAAAKAYLAKYPTGPVRRLHQEVARHGADGRARRRDQGEAHRRHDRDRPRDPGDRPREPQRALRARLQHPPQRAARRAARLHERPAAVEFSKKAIALIESGKTLAGVPSFDKNATLAWLTQILAIAEAKNGSAAEAIKLYEKSTALAPADPAIAARNLLAIVSLRQAQVRRARQGLQRLPGRRIAPPPTRSPRSRRPRRRSTPRPTRSSTSRPASSPSAGRRTCPRRRSTG